MTKEEARKYCDMSVSPFRYFDKNGKEIKEGDTIYLQGRERKVYLLDDEESLGIDATNPSWIKSGRTFPCEYGCYRLLIEDLKECELIKKKSDIPDKIMEIVENELEENNDGML